MPPLLLLAALGVGAYAGFRMIKTMADDNARATVRERARPPLEPKDLGTLEYDPKSGEYRPMRR